MQQPNRNFTSKSYRYGFQGQEKDDELKGKGNSVNYKYRMHDPRVGRFFAVDPLTGSYPYYSPYQFGGNNGTRYVELEGLEQGDYIYEKIVNNNGETELTLKDFVDNGQEAANRFFVLDPKANKDTPNRFEYNGKFYEMEYIGYSTDFYGEELDGSRLFNRVFNQYEKDVREYLYFSGADYSDKNYLSRLYEVDSQDGTFEDIADLTSRKISRSKKVDPKKGTGVIEDASKIKRFKSARSLVKEQSLPTRGKTRFIPRPKDVKNGTLLRRDGGFVDKFGNTWKKGPSRTKGESFEWDVQLTKTQGKKFKDKGLSRDGKHLNVSLKGKITHK